MTSPFELAQLVGGPLDGTAYERRGSQFPRLLEMPVGQYIELYVAGIGRMGNVVYRHKGRLSVEAVR